MSAPTIPFGPTAELLGLEPTDFEFVSLDGPQESLENETLSTKKDGTFLRWAATRSVVTYTANYIVLDSAAATPDVGLLDASLAGIGSKVWVRSVNQSAPQEGDQTLAVTFAIPADVAAAEGLDTDLL